MKPLDSFISSFRERTRSPFYGAFIIAWLGSNWRILIALFFFSEKDLGNRNMVSFIYDNYVTWSNCLWYPLFFSVVIYTLVVPWLDYFSLWYTEWVRQLKTERKMELQKSHQVDGKRFIDLLVAYDERQKLIIDSDQKIAELEEELSTLKTEAIENTIKINELSQQKSHAEQKLKNNDHRRYFPEHFYGRWTMYVANGDNGWNGEPIELRSTREITFVDRPSTNGENNWPMLYLDIDFTSGQLFFVLHNRTNKFQLFDLRMTSDQRWEGRRDNKMEVRFVRDILTKID